MDATNVYDRSGNGNDGILKGGLTNSDQSEGQNRQQLNFDGVNDFVEISDNDTLSFANNTFTMSFWINLSDLTNYGIIRKGGGPWEYSIYNSGSEIAFVGWNTGGVECT